MVLGFQKQNYKIRVYKAHHNQTQFLNLLIVIRKLLQMFVKTMLPFLQERSKVEEPSMTDYLWVIKCHIDFDTINVKYWPGIKMQWDNEAFISIWCHRGRAKSGGLVKQSLGYRPSQNSLFFFRNWIACHQQPQTILAYPGWGTVILPWIHVEALNFSTSEWVCICKQSFKEIIKMRPLPGLLLSL